MEVLFLSCIFCMKLFVMVMPYPGHNTSIVYLIFCCFKKKKKKQERWKTSFWQQLNHEVSSHFGWHEHFYMTISHCTENKMFSPLMGMFWKWVNTMIQDFSRWIIELTLHISESKHTNQFNIVLNGIILDSQDSLLLRI